MKGRRKFQKVNSDFCLDNQFELRLAVRSRRSTRGFGMLTYLYWLWHGSDVILVKALVDSTQLVCVSKGVGGVTSCTVLGPRPVSAIFSCFVLVCISLMLTIYLGSSLLSSARTIGYFLTANDYYVLSDTSPHIVCEQTKPYISVDPKQITETKLSHGIEDFNNVHLTGFWRVLAISGCRPNMVNLGRWYCIQIWMCGKSGRFMLGTGLQTQFLVRNLTLRIYWHIRGLKVFHLCRSLAFWHGVYSIYKIQAGQSFNLQVENSWLFQNCKFVWTEKKWNVLWHQMWREVPRINHNNCIT